MLAKNVNIFEDYPSFIDDEGLYLGINQLKDKGYKDFQIIKAFTAYLKTSNFEVYDLLYQALTKSKELENAEETRSHPQV